MQYNKFARFQNEHFLSLKSLYLNDYIILACFENFWARHDVTKMRINRNNIAKIGADSDSGVAKYQDVKSYFYITH